MTASFNDLSYELADSILKLLPRKSLASASLVCRTWSSISLPLLYHTICLKNSDQADNFIRRVLQEWDGAAGIDENNEDRGEAQKRGKADDHSDAKHWASTRLTSCVRRISVVPPNEEGLHSLAEAISNLKNLEHLHFDTRSTGDDPWHDILVSLHESLPKPYSLSLVLTGEEFSVGDSDKVVALTNIRELAIKFEGYDFEEDEEEDSEVPEMIVDLIRGASNIESLSLSFEEGVEWPVSKWVPTALFSDSALPQAQFPNLRTFRSDARHIVPVDIYDNDSTFRQFLWNHPNLHTIELDTKCDCDCPVLLSSQITMTPEGIVDLMPSVQHFEGPCVLVGALLKSSLAGQLQTLVISESHSRMLGDFKDLLSVMGGLGTPLPQLKKLEIHSETLACDSILAGLSGFAMGIPQLEELFIDGMLPMTREPSGRIGYAPASWDIERCMEPLRHLPHLRTLTLSIVPGITLEAESNRDQSFLLRVGTACLRLKHVQQGQWKQVDNRWDIIRRDGVPVELVHMRRRKNARDSPFEGDNEEHFEVFR